MKANLFRKIDLIVISLISVAIVGCGGSNDKRYAYEQSGIDSNTDEDNGDDNSSDSDPLDAFNTYQGSPTPSPSVTVSVSPSASASPTDNVDDVEVEPSSTPSPEASASASPLPSPRSTPLSIAVIGDGNVVGLHASHTRGSFLSPRQIDNLNESAKGYRHRDYDDLKHNLNSSLNFATGLDSSVNSIAKRLREKKSSLKIYNAGSAIDGIDAMLSSQVENVISWSESKLKESAPDVVVIQAGLSDLCADKQSDMTPSAEFGEKMHNLLVTLLEANSRTRILLVLVAPYHTLYDQLQDRTAYRNYLAIGTKCKEFWDKNSICSSLTKSGSKTTVKNRVNEYNNYLKTSASSLNSYYGDRIHVVTKSASGSINPDDVSMDCLHLSHEGQDRLASQVWGYGWW